MVVSRTFRAAACASCRLSILRSFTSLAGPSIRAPQVSARASRCSSSSSQQLGKSARLFSDDQKLESSSAKEDDALAEEALLEGLEASSEGGKELEELEDEEAAAAVPWYLQVESPHRAPKLLSERQNLPDLPDSPPPILQPLLQQISIDLGFDDLSLLDLRKLDPPPALGANLLMILGTARSEKHLHVSADRLCRWLRSNYKLRPDADGLLGRNELKLKLKRKAKRAKLMGSANDDNGDDGVRTGWVCVDIGVVDGGESATADSARHDNFVGFGRRTDGVRIVVQMLTEEKRQEIELEKLWSGILKRGSDPETDLIDSEHQEPAAPSGLPKPIERASLSAILGRGQTRELHTSTRRMLHSASSAEQPFNIKVMEESLIDAIMNGDFEKAVDVLRQSIPYAEFLQQDKWKLLPLQQMRTYLENVPQERAIQELGIVAPTTVTTPYLTCFNELLSSFPTEAEADIRIWLACFARDLGHPDYTKYMVFEVFKELQSYGVKISQGSYMRLLKGILGPVRGRKHFYPYRKYAEMAMNILQTMHDQGLEILNEDLLVYIQELVSPRRPARDVAPDSTYTDPIDTFDLPSLPMYPIQERLHALIMSLELPPFKDVSRMRLMDLYARLGNWKEFFEIFRMASNQGQLQSATVYAFMFGSVARTDYQKSCMAVLRTWIPDLESAKVELDGELGEAVKACLRVADPFVEQDFIDFSEKPSEWLSLWKRIKSSEAQKDQFLYE
ncbi:ATPase synthesis protein 25 mitochondrial [Cadophora gregata]|uniref:ATPase synthesis protein 25 mitochondrial n=1 Tax=Cadophora gregata TaxID=51156 RepID=UPI0026DD1E00|nr:ATPase synthesis protein 25 mitochondrial [Cadophora gregata]KAK0119734.1 ATPase synthesis protein 25 mitochondrial [Cadophora gregata]KAK0120769.1 ATPase synthesis protein 25 mitochondrial [Cadophora gregata f. sp. sojae]